MQMMDCVEVIVEKESYAREGVHKGMQGWICYEQEVDGYWLVNFPQYGEKNDIAEIDIKEEDQDANILAATASAPDMLMSLNADKCDLVVTDQPTGKGALVAYPDFKLLEFGGGEDDFQVTDEDINIGISLKKGNTELKEAIDSVLSKMTKDDFSAMMDEAISVQPLAN